MCVDLVFIHIQVNHTKPFFFFFGEFKKNSEGYDIMRELQLVRDDNSLVMLLTVQ